MIVDPEFSAFEDRYARGEAQVVWTSLIADLETPVAAFLKLAEGRPFSFLFESVEGGATIGRYSFITMKPDVIWRCRGDHAEINRQARFDPAAFVAEERPPLESLRALWQESQLALPPSLPPMAAGLIGYFGYDMVRQFERIPDDNPDHFARPDSIMVRPTVTAVFDRVEDQVTVITPVWPDKAVSARA